MQRETLFSILEETGLDVVYRTWDEGAEKPLPYIAYRLQSAPDFQADNINYAPVQNWVIELYSEHKDDESEQLIRDVLTAHKIPFSTYESQVEKNLLLVYFTITTF